MNVRTKEVLRVRCEGDEGVVAVLEEAVTSRNNSEFR